MEALAARLVSAFAGHEVGLEEYLDGLRPDELHGLTALLESNARRKVAVVPLLQVLLHLPATRLPAARSVLRLIQTEVFTGHEAVLCLSELRIAILRHWVRERPGRALGSAAQEARGRLDALLQLGEDVLAALEHRQPTATDQQQHQHQQHHHHHGSSVGLWASGGTAALQLVPALLSAADKVHAQLLLHGGDRGSEAGHGLGGEGGGGGGGEGEGDGEGEFPSRLSATIPTTRAATATRPTSPIAPCLADTRDLGAVAVAGTGRGGGSAGTVSSTSPLIAQLKVCEGQGAGLWSAAQGQLALQCGDGREC